MFTARPTWSRCIASLLPAEAVEAVLHQRHRASSAIEGFNAALRPYGYVHEGATQGFLDLVRRPGSDLSTRRCSIVHKLSTSGHECLTGQPVHDWLTVIGCTALADSALIPRDDCRALGSLDTPDPEHCGPRDMPARVCKRLYLPHFDWCRQSGLVILLYELQSRIGAGGSEKGSRRAMPVR